MTLTSYSRLALAATLLSLATLASGQAHRSALTPGVVSPAKLGALAENAPLEVTNSRLFDAIAKLSAQVSEQQKQIQDLHSNLALLQIQSGAVSHSVESNSAATHIQIASIAKGQANLQTLLTTGNGAIPESSSIWKRLDRLEIKQGYIYANVLDQGRRLLMTCILAHRVGAALEAHSFDGKVASNKGGDVETCTAAGWNAASFKNFDVPFGGPPH
jgi:uncharacterized coiled-coil protein SlyX